MKHHEFVAKVRDRGGYGDQAEAERVTRTVLGLLAQRLAGGEAKDLAAQLPAPLQDAVLGTAAGGEAFGVEEFLRRLAERVGGTSETARRDAGAVLSTVAEAVSGGEVNQVLTQLQSGYAALFGKPDLA